MQVEAVVFCKCSGFLCSILRQEIYWQFFSLKKFKIIQTAPETERKFQTENISTFEFLIFLKRNRRYKIRVP